MSQQRTNIKGALALAGIIAAMAALGAVSKSDAEVRQQTLNRYCEGVAIWQAAGARGIPKAQRLGQPDYKDIAAEQCPGLRPAAPPTHQRQLAQN